MSESCPIINNNVNDHQQYLEQFFVLYFTKVHYQWEINKNFNQLSYQQQYLENYFPSHGMISVLEFLNLERLQYALLSYLYTLNFIEDHVPFLLQNLSKPTIIEEEEKLILSQDSALQLHIISSNSIFQTKKNSCLLEVINHPSTPMGKRLLRDRLLSPINNINVLEERYQKVENCFPYTESLKKILTNILDIERLHRRALLGKLSPTQFYSLHDCYLNTKMLSEHEIFSKNKPDFYSSLINFMAEYQDILDLEKCSTWNLDQIDQNPFKPGINRTLDEYQKKVESTIIFFDKIANIMSKTIDPSTISNIVRIEYNEREGYHLSVTQKRLEVLKKNWPTTLDPFLKSLKTMEFKKSNSQNNKMVKIFSPEIRTYHEERIKYQSLIH